MIRAVIDTNVWVSGLLSSRGAPAQIVDLVLAGRIIPVVASAILDECEDVLLRPELGLPPGDVRTVLSYLKLPGEHVIHVDPGTPDRVCSDPDDDVFLSVAIAGNADYLVTGNLKHFPRSPWRGVRIVSPTSLLRVALAE